MLPVVSLVWAFAMRMPAMPITSEAKFAEAFREHNGNAVVLLIEDGCDKGSVVSKEFSKRAEHGTLFQCATLPDLSVHQGICFSISEETRHVGVGLRATRTPFVIVYDRGERVFDFVAESRGALVYGLQEASALVDAYEQPPESFA
mmetsp:Transcript_27073/g.68855  ORF Transcript_27073/g.68855 Transcript_27073/m.68855 type:complete len:146 (-) Transcript_27073:366-803(-)|eukprot:CAMPEP_0115840932 /NCGR_PEP_ID=MMETSP0287-20121206/7027_1 /TAXON_ID=412157 /ORGANISM="Chrysochromulina rotalis, Strain UIO044" /LENGTH=145 /DNA_ID=CAMNT_0003294561 /DNA_START=20 /DNA_END=457 /DNA_ORIENTATION=+